MDEPRSGDDLTAWSAEVAHDIAKRWLERPIEDVPVLPLGVGEL